MEEIDRVKPIFQLLVHLEGIGRELLARYEVKCYERLGEEFGQDRLLFKVGKDDSSAPRLQLLSIASRSLAHLIEDHADGVFARLQVKVILHVLVVVDVHHLNVRTLLRRHILRLDR